MFKTLYDNCLMALDLKVVLNSASGVKIIFVRFSIDHVYNKVKDIQISLNFINFTSLGSFISLKVNADQDLNVSKKTGICTQSI